MQTQEKVKEITREMTRICKHKRKRLLEYTNTRERDY